MGNTIVSKIGRGNVIEYNGEPCTVIERNIHTPPNMASFCSMQLKSVKTGKTIHVRTNVGDSYNVMHKEIKRMEYSYENQGMFSFMDLETFEQIELDEGIIGNTRKYLVEGKEYDIFCVEGQPLGVELPASIQMKVVEAPEMIKGDSSGAVQKTVVTETGLEIRTPAFIKVNDIIKINPETNEYQGRA